MFDKIYVKNTDLKKIFLAFTSQPASKFDSAHVVEHVDDHDDGHGDADAGTRAVQNTQRQLPTLKGGNSRLQSDGQSE